MRDMFKRSSIQHCGLRIADCRRTWLLLAAIICCLWSPTPAFAQGRSLFGSSGPSARSQGGTVGGSMSGGLTGSAQGISSAFGGVGSTGAFGSGRQGSFSNTSLGGMGPGQGGYGTSGQQGGLVGQRSSTGRFVGQSQTGTGGQMGQFGRGAMNQFGRGSMNRFGANGMNGLNGMNGMGSETATPGAARLLHPQQKLGFTYVPPAPSVVSGKLNHRFEKLAKRAELRGARDVSFDVQGTTVTVKGEVDSEETKRLVGMLAGLEPGVGKVQNELAINSSLHHVPVKPVLPK